MGINCSKCCSCSFFIDEKISQSFQSETDKPQIDISPEEILEKLQIAKKQVKSHLGLNNLDSRDPFTSIEETSKGHLLKVNFEVPVNAQEFCLFLDLNDRKSWDKLIDSSEVLESTKDFSIIHLKYKSQISYSAKEVLLASTREITNEKIVATFISIPSTKIAMPNKVDIFEGGYELLQGTNPTQVSLLIHMNIGSKSLNSLFQKISEKIIRDIVSKLKTLLSNEENPK